MWGLRGEMERNHPSEPFKGGRPMSAASQHQTSGLSSSPATLIQVFPGYLWWRQWFNPAVWVSAPFKKIIFGTYSIAHGTLLHVLWQPEWEGSFGEDEYTCMCGWIPSLFTWNYHNGGTVVSQLLAVLQYKINFFFKKEALCGCQLLGRGSMRGRNVGEK